MNAFQKIAHQMSRLIVVAGVTITALSATAPAHATSVYYPEPSCFAGCWNTGYGPVVMKQSGSCVTGCYAGGGASLCGQVSGNVCQGTWTHGCDWGYFKFYKTGNGCSFGGGWAYSNGCYGADWNGTLCQPNFQASWCTTFGTVKLFVDRNNNVYGQFNYSAAAGGYLGRIDGKVSGNVITGTWQSGTA